MPGNILYLYLIKISKWFNLVMPVVVLFYQENGMNMQQIFMLKSVYSLGIVVMEIPSGYLADVWGRKKTLLMGAVLGATGFALYSFSYGFWAFAVAELVLGIGYSFVSGADAAMLYDTLKSSKREGKYIKQEGRITSAGNFAEAFAGICGGLLATISLRMPFYFQFAVASIAIPAAFLLKEPNMHAKELAIGFKAIFQTVRQTFLHVELRSALLVSSFTGTASLTFAWFAQPYFQKAGLPVSLFGLMWTLLNLSAGISAFWSYKVERRLGQKNSLLFIIAGLSFGYFFAAWEISLAGIAILFFFYVMRGISHPILKDYINRHTGSEVRATILSLRDFVIRINFAVIGPVLGYFTDHFSLGLAMLIAGGSYLLIAFVAAWPLLRTEVK
ncbi:MAG TPA: MFS transporter [Prolixibacteraceae bacterium]|nr:MFS transporter [Prolixibacteraceae bacterium]HCR91516.1 MFS transporter [Prolixibacteraceae bacterium]HCU60752.1 MFS transporter [Prolixibacteraceae bacterium]